MRCINYRQHIQKAIDYIEENLKCDIGIKELARTAGYSEYHFLRVFRDTVHLTPADYIRKRRISEIVRRMEFENRTISDIAFEYGFNSKENFIRAFKTEHHILPTEFKLALNSLKLCDRIEFDKPYFKPNVTILILDDFRLCAYKSDEDYTPNFWNKYNAKKWSTKLSGGQVVEDFGACIWNAAENKLDYYIGIRQLEAKGDQVGTVTINITGGLYAIFHTPPTTHFDFVNTIHRTWDYIGRVWLPENGYKRTGGFELESYIEESREFSERIYIPIVSVK